MIEDASDSHFRKTTYQGYDEKQKQGIDMNLQQLNLTKSAYSINELLSIIPLGRSSINLAIKSGELKAKKYGTKVVILAPDIAVFLESL